MKEESKDFESKLENIKQMLDRLTNPEIFLKESVELYKNGMKEIALAQKLLDDAKCEFETLNKDWSKQTWLTYTQLICYNWVINYKIFGG